MNQAVQETSKTTTAAPGPARTRRARAATPKRAAEAPSAPAQDEENVVPSPNESHESDEDTVFQETVNDRSTVDEDIERRAGDVDRAMAEYVQGGVIERGASLAVEPTELAPMVRIAAMTLTPGDMSLDMLERLVQLQEQFVQERRRVAFDKAMAEWRKIAPVLDKDRHVHYPSSKEGEFVDYRHSSHGEMMSKVNEPLGKLGINIKVKPRVKWDVGFIELDITTTFEGHSETITVPGEFDRTGGKTAIQAMSSAITRLTREGIRSALMLASRDDDDGLAAAGVTTLTTAPAQDEAEIKRRMDEIAGLLMMIEALSEGYRQRFIDRHSKSYPPADNALGLAIPAAKLEALAGVLHGRLEAAREAKDKKSESEQTSEGAGK